MAERGQAAVAPEDKMPAPGALRGAGARSPLFWKLMLVSMALIWGYSFFVMKDIVATMPAFLLLVCRFIPAAIIMLVIFRKRVARCLDARHVGIGVAMGVVEWAAYALQTLGLVETTAGKNAFLTGTYCILVPFIAFLISREKLTRYNLGAAVLCLAGIGLVALDSLSINRGDLLTLAGAAFFALQIALVSKYGQDLDVNVMTFWMFVTVGTLSAVTSFAVEPAMPASAWTPSLVMALAFLAVFCTCVALLVQNLALAHVPPATGSLLLSLESPSGVFFSVVFTGEVLTGRLLLGFALIFLSIVVSETKLAFLRRLGPAARRQSPRVSAP